LRAARLVARGVHCARIMRSRTIAGALGLFAAGIAFVLAAGCSEESSPGAQEDELQSCGPVWTDPKGVCRKPNGQYAKKKCCAPIAVPSKRRSLESYQCPEGDGLIPVAFFDADSTLRISRSGSPTADTAEDVYTLPFVAARIADVNAEGYLVAIASNQGGVSKGVQSYEDAEGGLITATRYIAQLGGKIDWIDFAENYDDFRKPAGGMGKLLDETLVETCGRGIDWERSYMIGDAGYKEGTADVHPSPTIGPCQDTAPGRPGDDFTNSDRGFAETLGITFHEPTDFFGWCEFAQYNIHDVSELKGLLTAMEDKAELDETDDARAAELLGEVQRIRKVNGL